MADTSVGKITDIRNMQDQRLIKIRCHSLETATSIQEATNKALEGWTSYLLPEKNPELVMDVHLGNDIPSLYRQDR